MVWLTSDHFYGILFRHEERSNAENSRSSIWRSNARQRWPSTFSWAQRWILSSLGLSVWSTSSNVATTSWTRQICTHLLNWNRSLVITLPMSISKQVHPPYPRQTNKQIWKLCQNQSFYRKSLNQISASINSIIPERWSHQISWAVRQVQVIVAPQYEIRSTYILLYIHTDMISSVCAIVSNRKGKYVYTLYIIL